MIVRFVDSAEIAYPGREDVLMKVRIKGNAVRLRVLREELDTLLAHGRLDDVVLQAAGDVLQPLLRYALVLDDRTYVDAEAGRIAFHLSRDEAAKLTGDDIDGVSVRSEIQAAGGELIRTMAYVEVEKMRRVPKKRRPDPADWVLGDVPED